MKSGFVALVGKPNVGKSTLLNAYLEQKVAIVSDKPQTTRVRQLGILTRPDAQVIFIDTPGIHKPLHRLGQGMVETAADCISEADVIVFLASGTTLPTEEDRQVAALIQAQAGETPVILALNKCDLVPPDQIEPYAQAYQALVAGAPGRLDSIALSATSGYNRQALLEMIIARLPAGAAYYDEEAVTDRTEREIASDMIREQVLNHIYQEVPYSVAVTIEDWKERPGGQVYINATLYVERESQKGILIGQGGKMLKTISTAARREIEAMADAPVFLEVWIKVDKNWRQKDRALKRLGYAVPRREGTPYNPQIL